MRDVIELTRAVDKCKTRRQLFRIQKVIRALGEAGKAERTDALSAGWYAIGVETGMNIAGAKQ